MGFDFSGFVLRAPRTAPSNATTTDEASNGVDRDFKPLSSDYVIPSPELVEMSADQYRAAVLLRTSDQETQYLVWAANTANLSDVGDFVVTDGEASFPTGSTPVANENAIFGGTTGSNRVIVVDDADRSIGDITSLRVQRGDTGDEFQLVGKGEWNAVTGIFTITDTATLAALGGGVSSVRGDRATDLEYLLNPPTFWWSKNDIYETRFTWDGKLQRWVPLRGTPPRNLGVLLQDESYTLSPPPAGIPAGTFLPGDSTDADSYCMVRLGTRPDASSIPVAEPVGASGFGGIKAVTEDEVDEFDFGSEPTLAGVASHQSGKLRWNPSFVDEFAGQTIFYSYRGFVEQVEIEPLGDLEDANLNLLFISPIPGPTDYPFLRIGSRQPLQVQFADTEAILATLTIEEGEVGVALSTGRLKFSEADVAKADPDDASFDVNYLGAQVFYDGVSLTQQPVPMRAPVRIVNSAGNPTVVDGKNNRIYIPDAVPSPTPGTSGVLHNPDGTGTVPNTSTAAGIRPGEGSGLVREIAGPWDVVLFSEDAQIRTIRTFDDDDEAPQFRFRIPRGVAYVDLREGAAGSEVILGRQDLKRFDGKALYFLQSGTQPSVYAKEARIWSRVRDQFVLEGTEVLVFSVDGLTATWDAALNPGGISTSDGGTFTADEIAASLAAVSGPGVDITSLNGRVAIGTTTLINGRRYGDIEIGFGQGTTKDLSGAAALGFLPGWKVRIATPTAVLPPPDIIFLPDNGSSVGVFRSPFNLDGSKDDVSDVRHIGRFEDVVLASSISQSPIVLLDRVPLEDRAGYDEGIFFRIQDGLVRFNLENYEDVFYEFGLEKFSWAFQHTENETLEQPTNNLFLGQGLVIESSMRLPGNGLSLSTAGSPLTEQILNEDYILPDNGDPGLALLIDTVGALKQLGGRGTFTAGSTTFTDTSSDIDFVALGVQAGWQLEITQGDAQGTYVVAQDATATNSLEVEPAFPVSGGPVPWELYDGVTRDEFDPGIIADAQYVPFQHLPEDPWQIRVLSPLGDVPADQAAQFATRLVADLGDALQSGRALSVRYGLDPASDGASLVALQEVDLGIIVNSALEVPDPASERFANDNFSIRIGTKTYTFADGNLVKVSGTLSFPLAGDIIEVQEGTGLLNFGTGVFAQFAGQNVIYVEEFLTPNLSPTELPSGTVEYDPDDGALNFNAPDMATYGGQEVYLVEQMATEVSGQDVTLNPIQGSFAFTTPLREFQVVETHYFRAENGTGDLLLEPVDPDNLDAGEEPVEITEQLPLFVRLETATPESGSTSGTTDRWVFNPTNRTVDEEVEVALYVGSTLYNIGSSPTATFEIDNDADKFVAILEQPVDASSEVLVSYAVLEAFGGEQTYTVSSPPVYRPPFRIEPDQTSFTLETDRTDDMVPGKFLRVAEFPFYITASTYDAATNITTVEFLPETQLEAGSRDPGSDSLSVLSDVPLATAISPDAAEGFWLEITAQYEPVNRGFQSIKFLADLTSILVPGHLLELAGIPFIVSGVELVDGTRTQVDITSFFPRGFAFGQDAAKISVRPVYAPTPSQFLGRGGVASEEPFELILFGATDDAGNVLPGRTLRPSVDYELNLDDGSVEFLDPPQGPLLPTQSLYLRHTRQRAVTPVQVGDFVLNPRFVANFSYVAAPSEENGRLGQILIASYTFSNPDTFFYRTLPLLSYLGEVAEEVARDIAASLPSLGPAPAIVPPVENSNQGRLGLKSQRRDLEDNDRAARVFLEFYNEAILAFEQVTETISGNIVGDRDGKFQFFVGRHKDVTPPGYEDGITGELNNRNLFSEVFFGYNPKATFLTRDPVVDPTNFVVAGDQIEGEFIDPDFLADLQSLQREFATNDVDDIVLFARTRKRLRLFPLRLEAFGKYRRLGEPSRFSRIFPERADYFTLTDPGIQADLEADPVKPGVYAFRKKIKRLSIKGSGGNFKIELPKRASTFFKAIADVGNPVIGQVENIGSLTAQNRLARARIFAYSPTGFPEFDDALLGTGAPTFASTPRPAVIVTPLPLHELPLAGNGLPDISQLAANGGEVIDVSTGDPNFFTPPFQETDADINRRPKITFGRPDGRILDVQTSESISYDFPSATAGTGTPETFTLGKSVFVGEVLLGCIVTFAKEDHTPGDVGTLITSENDLLEVAEDPASSDGPIELFRGDTCFVTPSDAEIDSSVDPDEPSTKSNTEAQLEGLPNFRVGFDVGVDRPDGELRDVTFPSFRDPSPFGLKELLGQRPPKPLTNVEGSVTFRNGNTEPTAVPALTGGFTNDSGDYTLPYLYAQNTEIDQLGVVAGAFNDVFSDSLVPNAVYPDEIQATDGVIVGALAGSDLPAAINTAFDVTPVATAGAYVPNSGIGDVRPFDVLLVETGQTALGLPGGSQGILSVGRAEGDANGSFIEPPRFVTPTALGDTIRWVMRTAMSFVNQPVLVNPPGMVVREIAGPVTQFDITQVSTGLLVFNNGTPAAIAGGLNNFVGLGSGNILTIRLWTAPSIATPAPVVVDTIVLDFGANTATSGTGASAITGASADDNILSISTAGTFVTIGFAPPPVLPEDGSNPGDTIPLWFTIDIDCSAGASTSGFIDQDRLTLDEGLDLRSVLPRDEPAVAGIPVFSELSVPEITSKNVSTCDVNAPANVNGGAAFTFLARNDVYPFVGTFDPAPVGTGRGTVRVMGFEGAVNTPILTTSPVTFSALPSSDYGEGQAVVIAQGTGVAGATTDRNSRISSDGATLLSVTGQGLSAVVAGDVLTIVGSDDATPKGAVTAGTYLVKHAVEPNSASTETRDMTLLTTTLPADVPGWADLEFPTLVDSTVESNGQVEISGTLLRDGSTSAWDPAGGFVYFIAQPDPDAGDYTTANYKAAYTAVNTGTNTFQINAASIVDFAGTPFGGAVLDALPEGTLISGFFRFDVTMDQATTENLPRNTVGSLTGPYIGGFESIGATGPGGTVTYDVGLGTLVGGAPAVDEIGVTVATPIANTAFVNDENAYVYDNVPQYVQIDQTDPGNTTWDAIHSVAGLLAVMPGDSFETLTPLAAPGYHAQAGIFLEPSWPKPVLDLAGADERVVDAGNSVAPGDIGFRDPTAFGEVADEPVTWEVRRIRRFHDVLENVGELLEPLRYVYETREGTVSAFGTAPVGTDLFQYPYVVTANGGTNLGPFNDDLVNINPGDIFRLFDDDGTTLLEEVEIAGIESGTQIWLKEPGITKVDASDVPGKRFEVYLRQVPVPHTQSNEQLFSQIVDSVLLERTADYTSRDGGFVPSEATPTDPRRLQDTDGTVNYAALGIQEGDIVLIDAAGLVEGPTGLPSTGQEQGTRAFGDRSVPNRTVATAGQEVPFIAGGPSELDDNRGWYRVTAVTGNSLTVSSSTEYSNDPGGSFVTFGTAAEYAVLPTVSGSTAPFADPPGGPGVEGQLDLRPTAFAGENGSPTNSFLGNSLSIAPFSYRVFRPSSLFSEDAVDLILLMRERTQSFLEEFDVFFSGDKFGSYFVFQRDEHVANLGNPLIPDEGKGVMSNELIDGVRGLVGVSPFANTTDSLSVLDRRFWVNDFRLDSEFPPGAPAGTPSYSTLESNANNPSAEVGDGRPVLPDRIEDVLDNDDQFREQRFAWLDFRVNREDGTLEQIRRFDRELPKKRREELKQLRLSKSIEDAGA